MSLKTQRRMIRKKTVDLVNNYGFSLDAIRIMQDITPRLPMAKVTEAWARYLLNAESLEEQRWKVMGTPLLEEYFGGSKVVFCKPKAVSYQLPGGRYTVDFLYFFEDGMRLAVDVKGSKFQKGYKDAVAKIRAAATLHWYDRFMMVMWERGKWQLEEVLPDKNFVADFDVLMEEIKRLSDQV